MLVIMLLPCKQPPYVQRSSIPQPFRVYARYLSHFVVVEEFHLDGNGAAVGSHRKGLRLWKLVNSAALNASTMTPLHLAPNSLHDTAFQSQVFSRF